MQTRRRFFNNLINYSLGAGVISSLTSSSLITKNNKKNQRKQLPVIDEVDICVVGGSCTGVFAAVRAARLGATVAVVEKQNGFGGVATSSLVNIWHSLYDTEGTTDNSRINKRGYRSFKIP